MDIRYLYASIDMLKIANCCINEDYIPILYDSLIRLQSENQFIAVYLWGRLKTLSDDYFIAYGHYSNLVDEKTFFYSQDIVEWILMPTVWPSYGEEMVETMKDQFEGDPKHVQTNKPINKHSSQTLLDQHASSSKVSLEMYAEGASGNDEQSIKDEQVRNKDVRVSDVISMDEMDEEIFTTLNAEDESRIEKILVEEDRLAIIITMIDNEVHIVPRGYLYKLSDGRVVKAPYFKGLDYSEICDLRNFLHLKSTLSVPKSTNENNDKPRCDYNAAVDFLEPIDKDIPIGCWAAQTVFNRYFVLNNLLWPGAVFFQDMNTSIHGFFYNGNGIKNLDLPFMLPC
ncbi:radial spoke head protein 9 homolog [Daktulosphaira vitifoliae]|uniref:radial spoke head protein 9 homolog n=1 Tax=Daktulosphaira vitifoliae TaxID=58002 RepID=UPI0021AAB8E3|nr:radial spoke head protein 9 homolog [Daktulosphaira vitifoliae]